MAARPWFSNRVVAYEALGLLVIIILLLLDEVLDLPHYLFGARPTPINWIEALFESAIIALAGGVTIYRVRKLFLEVRHLEGLLPICASCKKIRVDDGTWKHIEAYIRDHSDADFSHGLCLECAKKLYPEAYSGLEPGKGSGPAPKG